ncbi:MAG: ABC transporter substrate-binding protein, partial [Wenzhouxiangellaceae bacterium]
MTTDLGDVILALNDRQAVSIRGNLPEAAVIAVGAPDRIIPMRIITHTCSNTEIVCALGRADWLVGVDDHSDHPPEVVAGLPRIGPDLDIDIDRILALKPDLVITSLTVPGHEHCVARIRAAGLPHLVTR